MIERRLGHATQSAIGARSIGFAIRRNWWIMATAVPLAVGLVLAIDAGVPDRYVATATLVLEDPRASSFFELSEPARASSQDSARYLADQVEIIRSSATAEIASETIEGRMSPNALLENSEINGDANSNTVSISVTAPDPDLATEAADAIALAYERILTDRTAATIDTAITDVEQLVENIEEDISDVNARIDGLLTTDSEFQELRLQFEEALALFNGLRRSRELAAVGSDERQAINDQIAELLRDFTTWQVIFDTERGDPELSSLVAQRDALVAERALLTAERNAIAASSSAGMGGVVLRSPATEPEGTAGPSRNLLSALAAILGAGLATVASQATESRRGDLSTSREVLSIFGAPMLSTVPDLGNLGESVPVMDDPTSRAANRFRFAATALDISSSTANVRSILLVAPRYGVGTTTVVANLGAALAASGLNVLAIDGDLNDQRLSALLAPGETLGMSDVLAGAMPLEQAISAIQMGDGILNVLGRGSQSSEAASAARSGSTEAIFGLATKMFDVVLIDSAPLLEAAYVSSLARHVEGVVLVLDEATKTVDVEEVNERMELIGQEMLGYFFIERGARRAGPQRGMR